MKLSFFALLIAAGGSLLAQKSNLDVKPGLWESTTTTARSGGPVLDTSKMPPEAKQRIEQMMKKQQIPQTHTQRSCMTREKLDKDMFFNPDQLQASCKRTVLTNTARVAEVKLECTDEKYKVDGNFRIEALSRESVKGTFKTTGTMNIDMTLNAKWISDNCGDVK